MLKFQPTLNSSINLTAAKKEEKAKEERIFCSQIELNNFCVSLYESLKSRSKGKSLREHRELLYEWENYWDADTRDLTPIRISCDTVRSALTTLLVAFLLAGSRRMPKGFVFKRDLFVFKLSLVQTMCLILFTTSARLPVACVTN